jgi:hypothetical protein
MLKEGSMQNVCNVRALTPNLWEAREIGSSPVHLGESGKFCGIVCVP